MRISLLGEKQYLVSCFWLVRQKQSRDSDWSKQPWHLIWRWVYFSIDLWLWICHLSHLRMAYLIMWESIATVRKKALMVSFFVINFPIYSYLCAVAIWKTQKQLEGSKELQCFFSQSRINNTKSTFHLPKFHFLFKEPWLSFDSDDMLILWAQTSPALLLSLSAVCGPPSRVHYRKCGHSQQTTSFHYFWHELMLQQATGQSNRISAHGDILQWI